jgi:hypothetical protein
MSGEKPVSTAIEEAGISRGLYYQLETRALNAMLLALAPGAESDPSPDAAGLHHRIKELEGKVARAEQAQRRAERLLFVQRKMSGGPVKTQRGRPPKTTTSSTPAGRNGWRSSTTRKPRKKAPNPVKLSTSSPAPIPKPLATPSSIPTPAGTTGAP